MIKVKKQVSSGAGKSNSNFHWSVAAMFIGLFFGIFTFAFIGMATVVSKIFLSKVLAFFCFAGLLIPFRYYKKWFGMSRVETVLFNVMAIGPSITAILLWINFSVRMGEREESYAVISSHISSAEHFDDIQVIFTLEGQAYEEFPEFRTVPLEKENLKNAEAKKLIIRTADGALGYKVFLGNEAVTNSTDVHYY